MVPVALACQDTATLDQLLAETAQLFQDHDSDAADTIIMAFDKGTFTKVTLLCVPAPCSVKHNWLVGVVFQDIRHHCCKFGDGHCVLSKSLAAAAHADS